MMLHVVGSFFNLVPLLLLTARATIAQRLGVGAVKIEKRRLYDMNEVVSP